MITYLIAFLFGMMLTFAGMPNRRAVCVVRVEQDLSPESCVCTDHGDNWTCVVKMKNDVDNIRSQP